MYSINVVSVNCSYDVNVDKIICVLYIFLQPGKTFHHKKNGVVVGETDQFNRNISNINNRPHLHNIRYHHQRMDTLRIYAERKAEYETKPTSF
ncbi:hypothetical protein QE152_g6325 [Popillia japonica]|uniref:Uncharacterized protein n=1 Tax=Popillia japonica TaxID=7064 RepID=A0AAW1MIZ5_POPJA